MAASNIDVSLGLFAVACKPSSAIDKPEEPKNLCVGQPGKKAHAPSPSMAPATCGVCGPITDRGVLVKGFPSDKGFALLSQEDVVEAKETYANEYKKKMELVVHPAQQFYASTAPADGLNFLTPADAGSADRYQLLVRLVESHPELVFASLYTPRTATALFMLRTWGGVLMMEKRTRTQNLKPAPSVGGTVNEKLYAQLDAMVADDVVDYDPAAYEDKYRTALNAMIEDAEQVAEIGASAKAAPITKISDDDLMAKMQALADAKKKPVKKPAKGQKKSVAKVKTAA